ncbi:MAG TPA: hypothetical protein VEM40_14000 [Nitrospirota bacterium]|nr:hypothetical protein [Nitrospirota bacterium]
MIGVIARDNQRAVVEEFFQLFKTPWEFWREGSEYSTIIITCRTDDVPSAALVILYCSETTPYDIRTGIRPISCESRELLENEKFIFPVYAGLSIFKIKEIPLLHIKAKGLCAGYMREQKGQRICRIGYDLFDEIAYVLTKGQPLEFATIPTIEIHIAFLKRCILDAGIPIIDIPPVPYGYHFMVCLTHDVDFIRMKDHGIDHSVIGFLLRSLLRPSLRDSQSKIRWSRLLRNWKAVLMMPFAYAGVVRDPWYDIDCYQKIEKDIPSTFFFVPRKDYTGKAADKKLTKPMSYRSIRYDVKDYAPELKKLAHEGREIALHGIDAWRDAKSASTERDVIRGITGDNVAGVRMHWLYFADCSPEAIGKSGLFYDSSLGYNDAAGFRSGTTQVFCLDGHGNVYELPLNIMDTALFSRDRMGLSEYHAMQACRKVIECFRISGGVLTINWHTRSLRPERNWDGFYCELIQMLKAERAWFAVAKLAVEWFRRRRTLNFSNVSFREGVAQVTLMNNDVNWADLPPMQIRVHIPASATGSRAVESEPCIMSVPWHGESHIEIKLWKTTENIHA